MSAANTKAFFVHFVELARIWVSLGDLHWHSAVHIGASIGVLPRKSFNQRFISEIHLGTSHRHSHQSFVSKEFQSEINLGDSHPRFHRSFTTKKFQSEIHESLHAIWRIFQWLCGSFGDGLGSKSPYYRAQYHYNIATRQLQYPQDAAHCTLYSHFD